jgi:hypothetical protein
LGEGWVEVWKRKGGWERAAFVGWRLVLVVRWRV